MKINQLKEPVTFPQQYQVLCEDFLRNYWKFRMDELQGVFGISELPDNTVLRFPIAENLRVIALAATGEVRIQDTPEVEMCIDMFIDYLFKPAAPDCPTRIPDEFWTTPIGMMFAHAIQWTQGDNLITMTEAAEISGRSVSVLSHMVDSGKLTSYPDMTERNPRKRNRLLKNEIEAL